MVKDGRDPAIESPDSDRIQKIVDHAHRAREESVRIHRQVSELKEIYQQQLRKPPLRIPAHQ